MCLIEKFIQHKEFTDENKPTNFMVYLDVVFPIVFTFEYKEKIYLSYVVHYSEIRKYYNIIATEIPNYNIMSDMLEKKQPLFSIFDREYSPTCLLFANTETIHNVTAISLATKCEEIPSFIEWNRLYEYETYFDTYLLEDILPEEDFVISDMLINKADLTTVFHKLKTK